MHGGRGRGTDSRSREEDRPAKEEKFPGCAPGGGDVMTASTRSFHSGCGASGGEGYRSRTGKYALGGRPSMRGCPHLTRKNIFFRNNS